MKLHGYWRSSCTYRVRIALGLKGLGYDVVPVHLLKAQHKAAEYVAVNPSGQVPVLEVDGEEGAVGLAQSVAILEYLEEAHPMPALMPEGLVARARVRQLNEIVNSGIQPLQNLAVINALKERGVDTKQWCTMHIRAGLLAYQALCEPLAGRFSVGDTPSLAECLLVPQLYNARRFAIDVEEELPLLARIDSACAELDAFRAAHPDNQPDAPSA